MTSESTVKIVGAPKYSKVILLGMDGLDPMIVSHLMQKGAIAKFFKA